MMHVLHLLRHAKSATEDKRDDHERGLTKRGRDAARRVGRELPGLVGDLDLVLCSSAVRTGETMELVLAGFLRRPRVAIEDGLYLASSAALLRRLRRLDETCGSVLVIGHNPGLHELALALAAPGSPAHAALAAGKFPTMARASFEVSSNWAELGHARHALVDYATPKSLDG